MPHLLLRRRTYLSAAAMVLSIALGTFARTPSDIQYPDGEEEWYVVKMQDTKCGYMMASADRKGDEVHSQVRMSFEIARAEATVKITMDQSYRETLGGRPIAFSHESTMGQMPIGHSGVIKDGRLTLTTMQAGASRQETMDFDPEIKFAWGQLLEQRKRGLKTGTEFTVKTYEPSMKPDGPVSMTFKVHGKDRIELDGKKVDAWRVTATMQLQGMPIVTESWVDEDSTPLLTTLDMGIAKITVVRSTREEALKGGAPPELFLSTFIPVEQRIDPEAREVTLRLRLPADDPRKLPELPKTGMQSFRRINDHEGLLTIRRIDWKKVERASAGAPSAELREYLRSSTMLDLEDGRIKKLARKAVRGVKSPADKADALRKFVTDFVEDKSLDVGFATASEVARNKAGDCTEHGVLLAALARSAGLPARGVSGIVQIPEGYAEGHEAAFGYHMWAQVNIGGQWVDIDAALRQTDCDPTHVALSLLPLNDEGILDSIATMLPLLGRLQIEVVEVK
ncbi:MAG TPA: transglutaminase family protein [Phycisphaerae bacterium]|nr:transglutaminase family protein [Phycisphaerae bacterium]